MPFAGLSGGAWFPGRSPVPDPPAAVFDRGRKLTMNRGKMRYLFLAMMAFAVCLAVCSVPASQAEGAIPMNEVYFPDDAFRQYISEKVDTDHDQYRSDTERNAVTTLSLNGKSTLSSLAGVEFFPALKTLYCASCKLSRLDLSRSGRTAAGYAAGESNTAGKFPGEAGTDGRTDADDPEDEILEFPPA